MITLEEKKLGDLGEWKKVCEFETFEQLDKHLINWELNDLYNCQIFKSEEEIKNYLRECIENTEFENDIFTKEIIAIVKSLKYIEQDKPIFIAVCNTEDFYTEVFTKKSDFREWILSAHYNDSTEYRLTN